MEDEQYINIKQRKMNLINLRVSRKRLESLPDYIKPYCNRNVYTFKDTPRIHGCGANHGTCTTCGKGKPMQKEIHKKRVDSKKYSIDFD